MELEMIDKRMQIQPLTRTDVQWHSVRQAPFSVHGLQPPGEKGPFVRMPGDIALEVSEGVDHLNYNTAGGRIRFMTDSPYVALHMEYKKLQKLPHMAICGSSGADLYRDGVFCHTYRPPIDADHGFEEEGVGSEDGQMHLFTLNFPSYNGVLDLQIGTAPGSKIAPAPAYRVARPLLFYGSSITQGACATRPGLSYENFLSRWFDADYINLGFSGSGMGEARMAEYLASIDCSVFICDYDYNAPDAKYLKETHKPLYEIFRAAQPHTPILMVGRPNRTSSEPDDRIKVIKETYQYALAQGDTNVAFIDGWDLFGTEDRDSCTVDGCHPTDIGFYRMAQTMRPYIEKFLSK